jgi:hypothetical protein
MGLFSRKPPVEPISSEVPVSIQLPPPRTATSSEEAGELFEQVGQIQAAVMGGSSLNGVGEELVSRIEGAALYFLGTGADPVEVFDKIIAPISEWGMARLTQAWLPEPGSPEGVAGKHAFDIVCALREKYQHLNPDNN